MCSKYACIYSGGGDDLGLPTTTPGTTRGTIHRTTQRTTPGIIIGTTSLGMTGIITTHLLIVPPCTTTLTMTANGEKSTGHICTIPTPNMYG